MVERRGSNRIQCGPCETSLVTSAHFVTHSTWLRPCHGRWYGRQHSPQKLRRPADAGACHLYNWTLSDRREQDWSFPTDYYGSVSLYVLGSTSCSFQQGEVEMLMEQLLEGRCMRDIIVRLTRQASGMGDSNTV
jgi:hypothetical protein